MNLLDYGLGLTPTTSVKTLASVGLGADVHIRGIYPIPGESTLVVTESGAFLYDNTFTLIHAVRITNLESRVAPFNEKSQDWTSECCSIPFYHMNPNRWGQEGHGFLVIRRTGNVTITNEDRGSQGIVSRTYAHWNIHFDPIDLSKPGPVVGQFHFQKSGDLSPNEFNLQEVTFLDGCSTSAFVEDHGDGYAFDHATGKTDFRYAEHQEVNTKWVGPNLEASSSNAILKKSRFWDSYAVFQVLIETKNQFFDWSTVDRSPSIGSPPEAVGCYLVFTNAACRGPHDPPMKLIRMHYTSLQEAFSDQDATQGWGSDGSRVARQVQEDKLPRGFPYLPGRIMATGKILWNGNFLYSNLNPVMYGGVQDAVWSNSCNPTALMLNVHERWDEQIWVKWDSQYETPSSGSRPWNEVVWPNNFQVYSLLGSEWPGQSAVPFSIRRKDICGMVSTKPIEYVPSGARWIPGMMTSVVIEKGAWSSTSGQRILIDRGVDRVAPSVLRRYSLRVGGIVAPAQNDLSYFLPHITSAVAQTGLNDTACRRPFVSLNPFRGWVTLRPLLLSTLAADASGCAKEIVTSVGAMTPYTPAGLQVVFHTPEPSSLVGSRAFLASSDSYSDAYVGAMKAVTSIFGTSLGQSAGSSVIASRIASLASSDPYSDAYVGAMKAVTSIFGTSLGQSAGSLVVASVITPLFGASAPIASVPDAAIVSPLLGEGGGLSTAVAEALVVTILSGESDGTSAVDSGLTPSAGASIAFDYAAAAHKDGSQGTTFSWSHTVTGSNTYLIVAAGASSGGAMGPSSATYNGVAMDVLGSVTNNVIFASPFLLYGNFTLFGLKNPDSGTHSVVVTNAASSYWETISTSYTGVNQTTPTGSFVEAHDWNTTSTVTATSASDELVVDFSFLVYNSLVGPDAGQTERIAADAWVVHSGSSDKPGEASTVMTWTHSSERWELMAVPLKP